MMQFHKIIHREIESCSLTGYFQCLLLNPDIHSFWYIDVLFNWWGEKKNNLFLLFQTKKKVRIKTDTQNKTTEINKITKFLWILKGECLKYQIFSFVFWFSLFFQYFFNYCSIHDSIRAPEIHALVFTFFSLFFAFVFTRFSYVFDFGTIFFLLLLCVFFLFLKWVLIGSCLSFNFYSFQ